MGKIKTITDRQARYVTADFVARISWSTAIPHWLASRLRPYIRAQSQCLFYYSKWAVVTGVESS